MKNMRRNAPSMRTTDDEVRISDVFPATIQGLEEDENLPEDTTAQDDQENETEQSLSHCKHGGRFRRSMKTWGIHQLARWYECYVLVEPRADSSWQPPSAVVVLVRHRNVQLVQS